MIEKDIGRKIQEIRKAKGFTQEQLAEKIGVSTHYMSALERGVYNIKLELLVNILNELDCSANEVFCDVVKRSYEVKANRLSEKLNSLPAEEQFRIYEVVDTMFQSIISVIACKKETNIIDKSYRPC